jgi:hypothetical protein
MNDYTYSPEEETPRTADSQFGGASEISRRVGLILDAVEREAQRLREEARVEASRYLEHAKRRADGLVAERQRRIALVSDELLAKSEAVVGRLGEAVPVQQGFANLVRALGDAAERLARETEAAGASFEPEPFHDAAYEPPPAHASADPAPPPQAPQPFAAQPLGYGTPEPPAWQSPPDEARAVAIQMATTGATRTGVREHLNRALGVMDTTVLLDEIFGAGTGEDAQVPPIAGPAESGLPPIPNLD